MPLSKKLILAVLPLTAGLIACGGEGSLLPAQPTGWDSAVALPQALDKNPDPSVIEIDLDARVADLEILPGKKTPAWTFNGTIPGPFVRAKVGDRLIAHLHNHLPSPTTIHWHGVRVPAEMDGAPPHSQPEVEPGGDFTYDFILPDAGLFWSHPHVDSAVQVGNGLYTPLLVEDPSEPQGLGDEVVLVLSDIGLREDGSLADPTAGGDDGTLFGREGNVLLVNGRVNPVLTVRSGLRQRWRLVNAAKSRYFKLAMAGHFFTRIGGDGGRMEAPVATETLMLIPGERADVLVEPRGAPGSTLPVRWLPYDRGYQTAVNRREAEVFRLQFSSDPELAPTPLDLPKRSIEVIATAGARPVDLSLTQGTLAGKLVLGINGVPSSEADPLIAGVGDTEVWTVENATQYDHPFHLHGFFFQVLGADGAPVRPMEWKDTVNVPVDGTVRFAVKYDNRPGMWMFHCHILDHADAGMMGMVQLER